MAVFAHFEYIMDTVTYRMKVMIIFMNPINYTENDTAVKEYRLIFLWIYVMFHMGFLRTQMEKTPSVRG